MDVYLAGSESLYERRGLLGKYLKDGRLDIKILQSYYYADEEVEKRIRLADKVMIDSGAFTFMEAKSSKRKNFDEYLEGYIDFINRNDVKLFLELDVDLVVGYEKVLQMRKRLEAGTGKRCIPVWHFSRGKEEFLKMCDEYDYVAFGGLMSDGFTVKELMKVMPWFIAEAHRRGAKIHGLGFTSMEGLRTCHFDSGDSSSWTSGDKYGTIYKFTGDGIKGFSKPPGKRAIPKEMTVNNFDEWHKFQKWAEANL